jgi:hypothetical protein
MSTIALLLCKNITENIKLLSSQLDKNNIPYTIICDDCSIHTDDILINQGFTDLTRSPYIKKPSAWDKSFYEIYNNKLTSIYNYFLFIEDDIYSKDYESIVGFINEISKYNEDLITKCVRPKSHHPTWKHWNEEYINDLKYPSQSFNPLCRLSKVLVEKIIKYKDDNKKFNFHEILIASLCIEYNLTYINYIEDEVLKKYIGDINYTPILLTKNINDRRIHHPVKDSKSDREKVVVSLDKRR